MSRPPVELICFDLGRVLVRICHDWHDACLRADVPGRLNLEDLGVRAAIDAAVAELEVGAIDQATFAARIADLGELAPHEVEAVVGIYIREAYAGVDALLDELHAAGAATACLSNTNATHWRLMFDEPTEPFAPLAALHHRFASHLIGARKPDPATYAYVEQAIGVAPERIVFFDDMAENIAAARARGWRAHPVDADHDDPLPQIRRVLQAEGVLPS